MNEQEMRNRRREARVPIAIPAFYQNGSHRSEVIVLDLSLSGLQAVTEHPPLKEIQGRVELELERDTLVSLRTTRVWCRSLGGGHYLAGYELRSDHQDRLSLMNWLREKEHLAS